MLSHLQTEPGWSLSSPSEKEVSLPEDLLLVESAPCKTLTIEMATTVSIVLNTTLPHSQQGLVGQVL